MKKELLLAILITISSSVISQTFTSFYTTDGLVSDNVLDVHAASNGDIWFGTQLGVSKFDGTTWTSFETGNYPGMADNNILSIFVNNAGSTWIGTDFGTSVFNGTSWTTYTTAEGLDNNKVLCINEDNTGNMWFGTINGLSKFDGTNWTTFGTADGLPFGGVNSITVHSNGELWIGTGLGGVTIYNGSNFSDITTADGLISNKIRAIALAANGKSWVGTTDGFTVLNNANTFLTNYTSFFELPAPDTLNPIEDVKIDGNGVVWAGVYIDYLVSEGGVSAFNGYQWFQFETSDGIAGPVVRAIDIAPNNDVWVATSTGVTKINNHTLGADEAEVSTFNIYPNPATSLLRISLNEPSAEQKEIKIYSMAMQSIKTLSVGSGQSQIEIDMTDLEGGVYIVKCGNFSKKVIKL